MKLDLNEVRGVVVPTITPLNEREEVEAGQLKRLVNHIVAGGVHGLFPLGTTGEFARLDEKQKEIAARTTIETNDKRVLIYMGVSDTGLNKTLRNIRLAESWGADIIVTTLPYYYPVFDLQEQLQFLEAVADSTELPIMLYNIPQTVGAPIHLDAIQTISRKPNIIGLKDSSGNFDYLTQCLERNVKDGFRMMIGDESLSMKGLLAGSHGLVPSLANVFPKLLVRLYGACMAGDAAEAEKRQAELDEINQLNRCGESWLGPLIVRKKALSLMGICSGNMSKPSLEMEEERIERLQEYIAEYA